MPEPFGISLFCDDIRDEINGKKTYVGVHDRILKIGSPKPARLPRLCIVSHIIVPSDFEFHALRHDLVLKRAGSEEVLGSSLHEAPPRTAAPAHAFKAIIELEISPLEVTEDCSLWVRAAFDETVMILGNLSIRFAEEPADSETSTDT
jgi:hypothetical protein